LKRYFIRVFIQERCSIRRYSQEVVGENKRDESAFSPYELYVLSFDFGSQKASDDILPLLVNFWNSDWDQNISIGQFKVIEIFVQALMKTRQFC
jgi:hypothetical protein